MAYHVSFQQLSTTDITLLHKKLALVSSLLMRHFKAWQEGTKIYWYA